MHNVRLTLCLLFALFQFGALKSDFKPGEIAEILRKANGEIDSKYGQLDVNESAYLVLGDSLLIIPQGRHYVFSYHKSRGTFLRIDRSEFHGHNFSRKLFVYKGEIYSFGGYGFWQTHGKLMRFSWNTREWELVVLKGTPPTGLPALSFQKGDSLYAFYTVEKHPERNIDSVSRRAYIIDLRTKVSSEYILNDGRHFDYYRQGWNDQNSRYAFFGYTGTVLHVIDKESLVLFTVHTAPSLFKGFTISRSNALDSNFALIEGNDILVFPKGSGRVVYPVRDYLELYCTSVSLFEKMAPLRSKSDFGAWSILWMILLFSAILIFSIWFLGVAIKKWRREGEVRWSRVYELMMQQPYYAQIRTLSAGIYSESEIDVALRIRHLTKSIRKLKRSTYLLELNRMQPGYIEIHKPKSWLKSTTYRINTLG
jgi:hypothetical protein